MNCNIYQFISGNPGLTVFSACFLVWLMASLIVRTLHIVINRPLRHMNIRKHGWPPAHCDADGDFKDKEAAK